MTYKGNPLYKEVFHSKVTDQRFYMPEDIANGYHLSRYVAGTAQDIYSAAGATKATLQEIMERMVKLCNDEKSNPTLRTDIAAYANNVLYRLKYPLDEDCCIRMGAIFTFIEDEDPDSVHDVFTRQKIALSRQDPELYSFFLRTGAEFTPSYKELYEALTDQYLTQRAEALASFLPQPISK